MKKETCLVFLIFFSVIHSVVTQAQDPPINLGNVYPDIIPPSPTVSSLGQYLDHPVDYFTGLPQINIPLYEVSTSNISVPIRLGYHASGITVDKMASWVGLGWSLMAGGYISRTVRGLPDDLFLAPNIEMFNACSHYIPIHGAGYLDCGIKYNNGFNYSLYLAKGLLDGIPDLFQYQIGQYSGEFVFDESGQIRLIPEKDIKITFSRNPINGEIINFIITTPDGTKYVLSTLEKTIIASKGWHDEEIPTNPSTLFLTVNVDPAGTGIPPEGNSEQHAPFISTWHLSRIETPGQTEVVTFTYRNEDQIIRSNTEDRKSTPSLILPARIKTAVATFIHAKLLFEISWPGGKVQFTTGLQPRSDVEVTSTAGSNNYALDLIGVYNQKNQLIKGFVFSYTYFQSTPPDWGSNYSDLAARFSKRLRLDGITEFNSNSGGPVFSAPYIFTYYSTTLPHRASAEKDFWGYYNHNNYEFDLIPEMYEYPDETIDDDSYFTSRFSFYPRSTYVGDEIVYQGADRNVDTFYCKASVLEKITFPTGGGIKFKYEPHEFFVMDQKILGGGLRLKEQVLSPDNSFPNGNIVKNYDYCNSGKILDLPQFSCRTWAGEVVLTRSLWDSKNASYKGGYVTYSEVKEIINENGYTDYNYLQPAIFGVVHEDYDQNNQEYIYNRPTIYNKIEFNDYDCFFRPYNPNYNWKRGLLNSKTVFNQNSDTLKKIDYQYEIKAYRKVPHYESVLVYSVAISRPDGLDCFEECKTSQGYSISPWIEMIKKTEKDYSETNVIEKITNYEHTASSHHLITSKSETNSDGRILSEKYKYIADIDFSEFTSSCTSSYQQCMDDAKNNKDQCLAACENLPTEEQPGCKISCNQDYESDTAYCWEQLQNCLDGVSLPEKTLHVFNMQREHYLSLPLETQILTDNKVVKGKVTEYDLVTGTEGNFYKPKKEFSLNTDSPIDNCQQIHLDNSNDLIYDSTYSLVNNYKKYSVTGNMQEIYKEDDLHTSYVWGYDNIYPIVKAENVSYEDLNTAVNASATIGLDTLLNQVEDMLTPDQKNQWHAFNEVLRNHSLLSNARVTTYTYKPLVGITSSTDPAGITTYYEYDVFGRLSAVKDINCNILKKYSYHYANE